MKFGKGSNAELTQKYDRVKIQNDMRMSKHIYKQTNIPDFLLCYPCECLAQSPIIVIYKIVITSDVLEHKWRASLVI